MKKIKMYDNVLYIDNVALTLADEEAEKLKQLFKTESVYEVEKVENKIIKLEFIPHGIKAINAYYGDPDANDDGIADKEYIHRNILRYDLPFPMRLSWKKDVKVTSVYIHKLVAPALLDALREIKNYKGYDFLRKNDLDILGGIHNFRTIRGYKQYLSTHSWAIAIDINPHRGEMGKPTDMPLFVVEAFTKRGFIWGGNFDRVDGMHFQACSGY